MYNDVAWDEVMAVNLITNAFLLRELHPLIAESDAGWVLLVTSGAARLEPDRWAAHAARKTAPTSRVTGAVIPAMEG